MNNKHCQYAVDSCFSKAKCIFAYVPMQVICLQREELNRDTVNPMHPSSINGVEDMSTLAELHEAAIMHNLFLRYQKDNIYVSFNQ